MEARGLSWLIFKEKEMGLRESLTQISAIFRSPVTIKLLIHCHTILSLPNPARRDPHF
jgi:hypothetical protein